MWMRKRNGKYRFIDNFKNPQTGKWVEVSVTFGKNNAQVRKRAQMLLDEKIKQRLIDLEGGETNITFGQLTEKYLEFVKNKDAYTTYFNKKTRLGKIQKRIGKDAILKKLKTPYYNKLFDQLLYDDCLSNETVSAYRATLSSLYEFGMKYGYLKFNTVRKSKPSYKNERERRQDEIENKYLTDQEFEKIITDCIAHNRHDIKDLFLWLYYTGMRIGEATSLQKKNILQDKDGKWFAKVNGTLEHHFNVSANDQRYVKENTAKTAAGNRKVYLSENAVKIAKRNCEDKTLNDFIFQNKRSSRNKVFTTTTVNEYLKRIAKRQGIKKNLTSHIFRHTHISKLTEMGVPLYVIQRRVGHESSKITERIYTHITEKAKDDLVEKLNEFPANFLPNDNSTNSGNLHIVDK